MNARKLNSIKAATVILISMIPNLACLMTRHSAKKASSEESSVTSSTTTDSVSLSAKDILASAPEVSGWLDANGHSPQLEIKDANDLGLSGAVTQCRWAPSESVSSTAWGACGASAKGPWTVSLNQGSGKTEGMYKFQFQVLQGGVASVQGSYPVYIHQSLDSIADCPSVSTDEAYFAAAGSVLSTSSQFGPNTSLKAPDFTFGLNSGDVSTLSLRKSFVMNEAKTLIVIRRKKAARNPNYNGESECKIQFYGGKVDGFEREFCDALVLNAEGNFACMKDADTVASFSMRGIAPHYAAVRSLYAPGASSGRRLVSPKTRSVATFSDAPSIYLYLPE